MKKVLCIIVLVFTGIAFCQDNNIFLLEKALENYKEGNIESTIKNLEDFLSEVKKENIQNNSDYEIVEFNRLKNFPSKYDNKKINLQGAAISSSVGEKYGEHYFSIMVSSLNQTIYFSDRMHKDDLVFLISDNLLEQLMDLVAAGYVGYFNVYTDVITTRESLMYGYQYYIAKIVGLEQLRYDSYTGKTTKTGVFLSD